MSTGKEYPLSLVIKAVDKATGPLRLINSKIARVTAPLQKVGSSLKALGEEAGLPKVGKALGGVASAAKNVGAAVFDVVKRLALMGAAVAGALFLAVKTAVDAGDALAKTSDRVGLAIDAFSELQFVAGRAGISQEEFTVSMDQFNKALGNLKANTGPLFSLLKTVSPALLKQVKAAKSNEDAFMLMMRALDKLKDPSKRAALAAAAFGRSGMKMSAMIQHGVGEIAELRAEYERIHGPQEKFARASEDLNDAMGDVGEAFDGLKTTIGAELFPVFTDLAKQLKEFIVANRGGIATWARETAKAISDWVKGGGIQRLIAGFKAFWEKVDPIVQKLGGWPTVIGGIAAAITAGPILGALGGLVGAFITLAGAIGVTPIGWFLLGVAAIASVAGLVISNWSKIKAFFADLFGGLHDYFAGFLKFVKDVFVGNLSGAWDDIKQMFSGGVKFLATILDGWMALMQIALAPFLKPIEWAMKAAGVNVPDMPSFRQVLGVDSAAPGKTGTKASTETKVTVDFSNLPRGTRVTQDKDSDTPVDLNMGYSMVVP